MTDCNRDPVTFSSLGSKPVVADFLGGRLTSDAGALLLREIGERVGLFGALNQAIPDPRDPRFIIHDQKEMLAQRIIAIALGYEDLNDHQTLRNDPALQVAAGRIPDEAMSLASPPTLCRLENRIQRKTLIAIASVLIDQFIAAYAQPPEHLTLDFDATDDPTHGHQEQRFFHGYYDHHCFLPLYVFCGDELVTAYLRSSKIDASKHSRALVKLLVQRLRQAWPEVKITIRADSGFCRWKLMRWCDTHGTGYVLGLARNRILERLVQRPTSRGTVFGSASKERDS
jgi:Transposase DDE domain group 1